MESLAIEEQMIDPVRRMEALRLRDPVEGMTGIRKRAVVF